MSPPPPRLRKGRVRTAVKARGPQASGMAHKGLSPKEGGVAGDRAAGPRTPSTARPGMAPTARGTLCGVDLPPSPPFP